jgi:Fe-S cluster assembly protein SufD
MVTQTEIKTLIPSQLEGEFQTLLAKTFSSEPEWLKENRKEAFGSFCHTGLPSRRNEEYKYTDVKRIFAGKFTSIHNEAHTLSLDLQKLFVEKNSVKLIFINGWLHKDSTLDARLPKGVVVGNMATDGLLKHADTLKKYLPGQSVTTPSELAGLINNNDDALAQLNAALWTDGAFIYVPENVELKTTIEIIHISTGQQEILSNPTHLIIVEKNSSVSIIESSISHDLNVPVIVNTHAGIFAGENSKIQFYRLQNDCAMVSQITSINVSQEKNSHFDTNTVTVGSEWTRNNLHIALNGENCESHLNGLFITNGNDHIDNHTSVQHNKPNCQSNQLYKGILDQKSTGIFNGKIFVARDAQKTNAYQSSKNILMSDDATINTKPQLEIYADDVKCSHGSTTGQLNEEALFYLRSRGLGLDSARNLLLYAFANDVLNTIRIDSLKKYLEELVNNCLTPALSKGEGVRK